MDTHYFSETLKLFYTVLMISEKEYTRVKLFLLRSGA